MKHCDYVQPADFVIASEDEPRCWNVVEWLFGLFVDDPDDPNRPRGITSVATTLSVPYIGGPCDPLPPYVPPTCGG